MSCLWVETAKQYYVYETSKDAAKPCITDGDALTSFLSANKSSPTVSFHSVQD